MSDFIQPHEYSMQFAAPEDDPSMYDWAKLQEEVDQGLPDSVGVFADITPASLQEHINVDAVNWAAPDQGVEDSPYRDLLDWTGADQAAPQQPADRSRVMGSCITPQASMTIPEIEEAYGSPDGITSSSVCDYPSCGNSFKSKGDLTRHRKLHGGERKFSCTAQDCRYSFTRKDKLVDHMRRGHDVDTLFTCSRVGCNIALTKDILTLHFLADYIQMGGYRQCPLPKCSFRTRVSALDVLQRHLIERHDLKGRQRFAIILADHGYDYESADVVCPVCPEGTVFGTHGEFQDHFLIQHCQHPSRLPEYELCNPTAEGAELYLFNFIRECEAASDEIREHRRTILSLWPKFQCHPVWNDIRECPT